MFKRRDKKCRLSKVNKSGQETIAENTVSKTKNPQNMLIDMVIALKGVEVP